MKKSDIPYLTPGFENYVKVAFEGELIENLKKSKEAIHEISFSDLEKLSDKAYAEGKWTVKQMFQHLIDTERIMAYRALRFARFDATPLAGFEENDYAGNADVSKRTLKDLIDEFLLIRETTISMFSFFTDEMLKAEGLSNNKKITVLALGFVIIGHQNHHYNVLKERYLPMLK